MIININNKENLSLFNLKMWRSLVPVIILINVITISRIRIITRALSIFIVDNNNAEKTIKLFDAFLIIFS